MKSSGIPACARRCARSPRSKKLTRGRYSRRTRAPARPRSRPCYARAPVALSTIFDLLEEHAPPCVLRCARSTASKVLLVDDEDSLRK